VRLGGDLGQVAEGVVEVGLVVAVAELGVDDAGDRVVAVPLVAEQLDVAGAVVGVDQALVAAELASRSR